METFREFVDWLERRGEVCTVSRSVTPKHELTAVMRAMQKGPNKALRFSGVAGSDMPVITNVFGFRKNAAAALGIPEAELLRGLAVRRPPPTHRRLPPPERCRSGQTLIFQRSVR